MNVFGYYLKAGLRHACTVNAAIAHSEPETGKVVILLVNQAIEMKGFNHHLLCLMQCCMNGVLIDEVPKFLTPLPSKITNAIQLENLFYATDLIFIPLKLNGVTSYFEVRTPT